MQSDPMYTLVHVGMSCSSFVCMCNSYVYMYMFMRSHVLCVWWYNNVYCMYNIIICIYYICMIITVVVYACIQHE